MNSMVVFFLICIFFSLQHNMLTFISCPSILWLLGHWLLFFLIMISFKSHILLLPSLTPFYLLLSSYFCFTFFFSLAMACFHSILLLLLISPTSQNLWDTAKPVLRGRFITIQVYLKMIEKSQIKKPNATSTRTGRTTTKPRVSKKKEII